MATLQEIREGLAANLSAIAGMQVSAYMLSAPTPPSAHVFPDETEYDKTMGRGHDDWAMLVQVFVGVSSDIGAQQRLDRMIAPAGAESVKEALEADATLAGVVDDLRVESCSGYRVYPLEGRGSVLGAEWRVKVLAPGI